MMFFRPRYPLLVCSCLVSLGLLPSAHAETIESTVQSALDHPSIESARADLDVAREQQREEKSGYFPELSVNSSGGRIYEDNATSRGFTTTRGAAYSGYWDGQVMARETIFDGFETPSRVKSAAARKKSAEMSLSDTRETLANRAAQAYLNLMRAHNGLAMLQEQKKTVGDYLSRIKKSVDSGTSDEAEYQQARDVAAILDGFINDYEGQARSAESDFFEATGRMPDGTMEVPAPHAEMIPANVEEAIEIASASHPTLRAARLSSQSTGYDIAAQEADLYPDISGEMSYLKSEKKDVIGGELEDAKALVRMNWSFETGGGQLARIREKKYQHQQSVARVQELQRQVERNVRMSYSELQTAQKQLENSKLRQELNTKLFSTYKVQFEGARISLLQMMQADNELFNTKMQKMNAEFRVLAAQYTSLASMGRLQESLNLASADTGPLAHEQE